MRLAETTTGLSALPWAIAGAAQAYEKAHERTKQGWIQPGGVTREQFMMMTRCDALTAFPDSARPNGTALRRCHLVGRYPG